MVLRRVFLVGRPADFGWNTATIGGSPDGIG
jgi:hypothetical protein